MKGELALCFVPMRAASKSGNLTGADLPANLTPAVRFPVKGSRVADVIDSKEETPRVDAEPRHFISRLSGKRIDGIRAVWCGLRKSLSQAQETPGTVTG